MPPHYPALAEKPRTLADVLLDIAADERENAKATRLFYAAHAAGDDNEADCQSDIGAAIDKRLTGLRDEARSMIEASTGVSWNQISEACL